VSPWLLVCWLGLSTALSCLHFTVSLYFFRSFVALFLYGYLCQLWLFWSRAVYGFMTLFSTTVFSIAFESRPRYQHSDWEFLLFHSGPHTVSMVHVQHVVSSLLKSVSPAREHWSLTLWEKNDIKAGNNTRKLCYLSTGICVCHVIMVQLP